VPEDAEMTTPDERRRNLIWGRETLEEFCNDDCLSHELRSEAAQLLAAYPSLAFLEQFDAGDPTEPEPYAVVLSKARWLFQRVATSPACSEQRKYSLTVVLRHFY
jgi:hypothetical protein